MKQAKFQVWCTTMYRDDRGLHQDWRWRLIAANGRIVAHGEGHTSQRDALRAVRGVIRLAAQARVEVSE